jgi:hypothetical protein
MAAAMAQEEAETRGKGGWRRPYCCCAIVVVVIVVVVLVAGVEAAEEGMCSGCSVFDFVFSALRTWDSMRKKQAKKAHHL